MVGVNKPLLILEQKYIAKVVVCNANCKLTSSNSFFDITYHQHDFGYPRVRQLYLNWPITWCDVMFLFLTKKIVRFQPEKYDFNLYKGFFKENLAQNTRIL